MSNAKILSFQFFTKSYLSLSMVYVKKLIFVEFAPKFEHSRLMNLSQFCTAREIELRHDKTNIMRLRPAWIQTSLRICAV
jgi:hypothetical protein